MDTLKFTVGKSNFVGKYCIGGDTGFCIFFDKKPSKIKRYFMKILLGWDWTDE